MNVHGRGKRVLSGEVVRRNGRAVHTISPRQHIRSDETRLSFLRNRYAQSDGSRSLTSM